MATWKEKLSPYSKAVGDKKDVWQAKLKQAYYKINSGLKGVPGIVRHAFTNLVRARVPEASAALAYYGLFSIFQELIAIVNIR